MKSKVYFARLNDNGLKERVFALSNIIKAADPFEAYKKDEIIPVKLTIGDSQCVHHMNPELVKSVVAELKKKKTRPFLFDTNVIYKGERLNAVDHLTLVNNKGFGHSKTGAPFVIADGLFGMDGKDHHIKSEYISKMKIPSFIGMLDSLVVLSHVTGHILSGYAGALKNVAMGMCSRPTKQVQHSSLRPGIIAGKCTGCGCCIAICPAQAISREKEKAFIDALACVGCGECICACKFDAVLINWEEDIPTFCRRMVEVADLVLSKFKNKFFINFAFDVTKECDCISTKSDEIVSRDIGILASVDPLALDRATVDLINEKEDIFLKAQGRSEYYKMFEYASRKGLGNLEYDLKAV